ncbi:hypothetical protein [Halospeciosus flavus]|uniref:Uncharacterized protein n=1 Tax=Halospeciosus flavus TaxID=3032283 RepID=A0ABD5Z024_9EURY
MDGGDAEVPCMIWPNRHRNMDAELEDRTEVILAWTAVEGRVVAGTNDGRLISRDEDGTWADAGQVLAEIRSLLN